MLIRSLQVLEEINCISSWSTATKEICRSTSKEKVLQQAFKITRNQRTVSTFTIQAGAKRNLLRCIRLK